MVHRCSLAMQSCSMPRCCALLQSCIHDQRPVDTDDIGIIVTGHETRKAHIELRQARGVKARFSRRSSPGKKTATVANKSTCNFIVLPCVV